MRQVAQAGGTLGRRAHIIARVIQPDLAGVHADAQPDRRKRRPLQLHSARHGVCCVRESGHEAVARTRFDCQHAVVGGHDPGDGAIEPQERVRHLLRLGLPQSLGALGIDD